MRNVQSSTDPVTDGQAETAVGYVLAELPLFLNSPEILEVKESLLVYHRPWALGQRIFSREFPLAMHENQGYLVVDLQESTSPSKGT